MFAAGKVAVVVTKEDDLTEQVIRKLFELGVKYIATRSVSTDHIDIDAAAEMKIKIAAVPAHLLKTKTMNEISATLAEQTIINLDAWQGKSCLGNACVCSRSCDRSPVDFLNPVPAKHEH